MANDKETDLEDMAELLDSRYQKSLEKFRKSEHDHEDLTIIMLKHQTNHISHLDIDLNNRIKIVIEHIRHLSENVNTRIEALDNRINSLEKDLTTKIEHIESDASTKITVVNDKSTVLYEKLGQKMNKLTWNMSGLMILLAVISTRGFGLFA